MKVYCINLQRRPDRREKVEKEFQREGLENVEFFTATDGCDHPRMNRGECGCTDSHIRVWRDIVAKGHPWALVFEDDARLVEGFKERLEEVLPDLPNDWDYVNLGAVPGFNLFERRVSRNLIKGSSTTAHAYIISQKGAQHLSHWKTSHVHFIVDMQVARTPMNMFYTEKPIAFQNVRGWPVVGFLWSVMDGDLGLFRQSQDFDFGLRTQWPWIIYFLLVLLVCYATLRL